MTKPLLLLFLTVLLLAAGIASAQEDLQAFRTAQLSSARVVEAIKKYNDSAARMFKKQRLQYPCHDIYIRAFKSQNEMELWGRNNENSEYRLVKTYRICSVSGKLGPKRAEGDRQVPEGCYFIVEFNPASEYYLSMALNYPNYSDKLLGKKKPGADIYLHGGCVTIGCLPMTDEGIKELYTICLNARLNGQANIPVHVYPTRLSANGMAYLRHEFPKDMARQLFWGDLKGVYDYFEKNHKLLPVMYGSDGRYVY